MESRPGALLVQFSDGFLWYRSPLFRYFLLEKMMGWEKRRGEGGEGPVLAINRGSRLRFHPTGKWQALRQGERTGVGLGAVTNRGAFLSFVLQEAQISVMKEPRDACWKKS